MQCLALKGHPLARVLLENLSSPCGQKAELKKSTSDSCGAILAGRHVAGFNPCPTNVDADMAFISSGSRETVALSTHTLDPSLDPNHTRVLWLPPFGGAIARIRLKRLGQNQRYWAGDTCKVSSIFLTWTGEAVTEGQGRPSPQRMVEKPGCEAWASK